MCGRYALVLEQNQEIKILSLIKNTYPTYHLPTEEIWPTNLAPILYKANNKLLITLAVWGFPQSTGKGVLINARAKTASQKKTFRDSFFSHRCVIPSTGFYEWAQGEKKQKYLFQLPGEDVLYLGGILKIVAGQSHFVILTTQANESVALVHSRMPLIIPRHVIGDWLSNTDKALAYLQEDMPGLQKCLCKPQ